MEYRVLKDLKLENKEVLVLVDFNIPHKEGKVLDDSKIIAHLPTIQTILKENPKHILLMSHLGRPKGKRVEELSNQFITNHLSDLLGQEVGFLDDLSDPLPGTQIVLMQNSRFNPEEESSSEEDRDDFAKRIIEKFENPVYINDGFASNHRTYATVTSIPKFCPAAAGLLVEAEIKQLEPFVHPHGKSVGILGGAKIADKIDLITSMVQKYDKVIIGGGMIFTFLKALGNEIGKSIVNNDKIEEVTTLLQDEKYKDKLILPEKIVIATITNPEAKLNELKSEDYQDKKIVGRNEIIPESIGLDVLFDNKALSLIEQADAVYWNGPMGVFEVPDFAEGTVQIGRALVNSKGKVLGGGGETIACKNQLEIDIPSSTGGGASSAFIIKGSLPGIKKLKENITLFP